VKEACGVEVEEEGHTPGVLYTYLRAQSGGEERDSEGKRWKLSSQPREYPRGREDYKRGEEGHCRCKKAKEKRTPREYGAENQRM